MPIDNVKYYLEYHNDLFLGLCFLTYFYVTYFTWWVTLNLLVMLTIIHLKWLETSSVNLFKWFAYNQMKANQDKCHLIISKNENV